MNFRQKLNACISKNNSLLCIGLDSNIDKIPPKFLNKPYPQFEFNKTIISTTSDLVCAYKLNSVFYEARGDAGIAELKMTCDYLQEKYPEIVIILDAKRGDIGSSNEAYVKYVFYYLGADGVTLNPYLGCESLMPFLSRKDKGSIILCKTSNPGAGELQDLPVGKSGKPLYQVIAQKVAKDWNYNGNCMLVVGATYPRQLQIVRHAVGDMPILVPGIGAQGGDLEKIIKAGLDKHGSGLIISASRSVIFASVNEAEKVKNKINIYRKIITT